MRGAEFWHGGQQSDGGGGADAFNLAESGDFGAQEGAGGNGGGEGFVEGGDLRVEDNADGAQGGSHAGLGAQETVFLGDAQREKLATSGAECGEFLEGRLQSGGGRGWKQRPVVAEDAGVDASSWRAGPWRGRSRGSDGG